MELNWKAQGGEKLLSVKEEWKGSKEQIDWRGASPVESRGCALWRRVPQKRCCRKCTDDWKGLGVGLMSRLSSPCNVDRTGPFCLSPLPPPYAWQRSVQSVGKGGPGTRQIRSHNELTGPLQGVPRMLSEANRLPLARREGPPGPGHTRTYTGSLL